MGEGLSACVCLIVVCRKGRCDCLVANSLWCAETKRSSRRRNLVFRSLRQRVLLPVVHLRWKQNKRGGEISGPLGAPCKTRNQCSVYSSLKLAHIEEGFGHVNANLSAISMFFFWLHGSIFVYLAQISCRRTKWQRNWPGGGGGYVCLPLPPFTRAAAKYMHILMLRSVAMLPTRVEKKNILTMSKEWL